MADPWVQTCHKQYKTAAELETHLSSYDHHHKKVCLRCPPPVWVSLHGALTLLKYAVTLGLCIAFHKSQAAHCSTSLSASEEWNCEGPVVISSGGNSET